ETRTYSRKGEESTHRMLLAGIQKERRIKEIC
ncbi:MAG: hypothetical protein ACI909_002124, partial [Planctomycetota bacterium]